MQTRNINEVSSDLSIDVPDISFSKDFVMIVFADLQVFLARNMLVKGSFVSSALITLMILLFLSSKKVIVIYLICLFCRLLRMSETLLITRGGSTTLAYQILVAPGVPHHLRRSAVFLALLNLLQDVLQ